MSDPVTDVSDPVHREEPRCLSPSKPTLSGSWNKLHRPSFPQQRSIWYGYGAYPKCREDKAAWDCHNRMGAPVPITIGHTWHGLDPQRDFEEHPDWFALTGGER